MICCKTMDVDLKDALPKIIKEEAVHNEDIFFRELDTLVEPINKAKKNAIKRKILTKVRAKARIKTRKDLCNNYPSIKDKLELFILINPDEYYTFYSPSLTLAGVVTYLLSPRFCAKNFSATKDKDTFTPILTGWDEWFIQHKITPQWFQKRSNILLIRGILATFVLGLAPERKEFECLINKTPLSDRKIVFQKFFLTKSLKRNKLNKRVVEVINELTKTHNLPPIPYDYFCQACIDIGE